MKGGGDVPQIGCCCHGLVQEPEPDQGLVIFEKIALLKGVFSCPGLHGADGMAREDEVQHLGENGFVGLNEFGVHPWNVQFSYISVGPGMGLEMAAYLEEAWEDRGVFQYQEGAFHFPPRCGQNEPRKYSLR